MNILKRFTILFMSDSASTPPPPPPPLPTDGFKPLGDWRNQQKNNQNITHTTSKTEKTKEEILNEVKKSGKTQDIGNVFESPLFQKMQDKVKSIEPEGAIGNKKENIDTHVVKQNNNTSAKQLNFNSSEKPKQSGDLLTELNNKLQKRNSSSSVDSNSSVNSDISTQKPKDLSTVKKTPSPIAKKPILTDEQRKNFGLKNSEISDAISNLSKKVYDQTKNSFHTNYINTNPFEMDVQESNVSQQSKPKPRTAPLPPTSQSKPKPRPAPLPPTQESKPKPRTAPLTPTQKQSPSEKIIHGSGNKIGQSTFYTK